MAPPVIPIIKSLANFRNQLNAAFAAIFSAANTWGGAQTFTVNLTARNFIATNAGLFFGSNGSLQITSDGVFRMWNNAGTDFGRLQFGGTTASFPSLKRNGTEINFRLADDSGWASIELQSVTAFGVLRNIPVTVSALPAAASIGGSRAFVTDATATTFNSVVAGSGSNSVPVFSDGTNWRIG